MVRVEKQTYFRASENDAVRSILLCLFDHCQCSTAGGFQHGAGAELVEDNAVNIDAIIDLWHHDVDTLVLHPIYIKSMLHRISGGKQERALQASGLQCLRSLVD